MNHHADHGTNKNNEYLKFLGVLLGVLTASVAIYSTTTLPFMESFMGAFFVVFSGFKLFQLKEFAYGFQSYDLVAKRSLVYAYIYPFLQLGFGLLYLAGFGALMLHIVVLVVSLVSGAGVLNSLLKKQDVHCVCLGNVIKLPLSSISFVEDFGMALMAVAMIIFR